jgi:hypothetical protein
MKKLLLALLFVVSFVTGWGQFDPNLVVAFRASNPQFNDAIFPIIPSFHYVTVTFNLTIDATARQQGPDGTGADIYIGLPGSMNPSITESSFTVFQNGLVTSSLNALAIDYSQPSSGIVTVDFANFKVAMNNQVTVPITVSFLANSLGNYGLRMDSIDWIANGNHYETQLYGAGFVAGQAPVSTNPIPEPWTYGAIFGLAALGLALKRR